MTEECGHIPVIGKDTPLERGDAQRPRSRLAVRLRGWDRCETILKEELVNDNARLWVAALRSGRFPQGMGALETDLGLCCLGVLCRIAMENGLELKREVLLVSDDGFKYVVTYNCKTSVLPDTVRDWAGLTNRQGHYETDTDHTSLTRDNDEKGLTFVEIADIIESEPKGLFVEPTDSGRVM
jgi:hypothetical protein